MATEEVSVRVVVRVGSCGWIAARLLRQRLSRASPDPIRRHDGEQANRHPHAVYLRDLIERGTGGGDG